MHAGVRSRGAFGGVLRDERRRRISRTGSPPSETASAPSRTRQHPLGQLPRRPQYPHGRLQHPRGQRLAVDDSLRAINDGVGALKRPCKVEARGRPQPKPRRPRPPVPGQLVATLDRPRPDLDLPPAWKTRLARPSRWPMEIGKSPTASFRLAENPVNARSKRMSLPSTPSTTSCRH